MATETPTQEMCTQPEGTVETVKHFMGGKWVPTTTSETVDVINPATGSVIAKTPLGSAQDVDQAVASAKAAFQAWRETPVIDRTQILFRLKTLLEEHAEELAQLITLENGKILAEARGDVRRGIQMVEVACGMPRMIMGEQGEDIARGIDCHTLRQPMGVFAAITPFNFPAMVPLWFWPFAIATGNTFILKPSERVPMTPIRIFELAAEAGIPEGVLNMVHGGKDVVNALCQHPDIAGISFVGSTPVAKHVYTTASATGKRVQALGGAKNFMVVLPDAVMDMATNTVVESCTGCAGQRCLAGSVVIGVGDDTYKQLETGIVNNAKSMTAGDGNLATSSVGPLISEAALKRVHSLIESAEQEGANILVDGRQGVDPNGGYFLKPTVISGIKPSMRIAKEEVFGPVILLAETKTLDEAIQWMNQSEFGNTASLFTSSGAAARHFAYHADPAMLGVNIGVPAPMAFFSFGGAKASFFGDIKAHGASSVDFYTYTKTVIERWVSQSNIW